VFVAHGRPRKILGNINEALSASVVRLSLRTAQHRDGAEHAGRKFAPAWAIRGSAGARWGRKPIFGVVKHWCLNAALYQAVGQEMTNKPGTVSAE
jgi:hypothetical protein